MKTINSFFWLIISFEIAVAQNLIPDSSFEQNKFLPMDFSAINASHYWSIPSRGTSDLYCKCDRKTKIFREKVYSEVDVPQNPMGNQYPRSGTCYAGFFLFSHGDYREYLQTPLTEPLQKNKIYLFTVHLSLADYSRAAIDQIGVCFLYKKLNYVSSDGIQDLSPLYANIDHKIRRDIKNWHKITVKYKAQGGETYVLFGSFEINSIRKTKIKAPKEVRSRINQNSERDAYYYVDDVSLVETYEKEIPETFVSTYQALASEFHSDSLLILKNVLFATNKTILLSTCLFELDTVVDYLKKNSTNSIEILGHTDNSGNEEKNKRLSEGRAKAVADYFVLKGIDKARINYKGLGSSKPVSTNETEEGRLQNRRVEFRVLRK